MIKLTCPSKIEEWYRDWDESMIWSYLQTVMGDAYADREDRPTSAIICVNCFGFAAGIPNIQLVQDWYNQVVDKFAIITARDDSWHKAFEEVGKDNCRRVERYAIKKEPDCFNVNKLTTFVTQAGQECEIRQIDEDLYHECKKYRWSEDFVQGYKTYGEFQHKGLGFVAICHGSLLSGASSYSSYKGGIKIEVDTKEDCRRKGLATACASKLILECLKRGLYPSWDAQNKWSLALAEKLGYHFSHTYSAYEVWK
ncbi:MAG: GNAT family N-acetyltransferase [Clostridiales bacterium]|nr:GNAT family N-acetyltransferase [Clostridiales bacterium]